MSEKTVGETKKIEDNKATEPKSFGLALPKKVATSPIPKSSNLPASTPPSTSTLTKDKTENKNVTNDKEGNTNSSKPNDSNTGKDTGSSHAASSNNATTKKPANTDSNKMGGALMLAGIDVNEEEALLNEHNKKNNRAANAAVSKTSKAVKVVKPPVKLPFLHPVHVTKHINKVLETEKILKTRDNTPYDYAKNKPEILEQLSAACELYMRDIITSALIASRHRRKNINHNRDSKKADQPQRSKVSRALRKVAMDEKKLEERRLLARQANGLEEKNTVQIKTTNVEETMAKASNATASLMTGGKKKYSWLTQSKSSASSPSLSSSATATETVLGPVATAIKSRGEMGIKYREPREEPGIVMRDFLRALENRRVNPSIDSIMTKGYSRIRD